MVIPKQILEGGVRLSSSLHSTMRFVFLLPLARLYDLYDSGRTQGIILEAVISTEGDEKAIMLGMVRGVKQAFIKTRTPVNTLHTCMPAYRDT